MAFRRLMYPAKDRRFSAKAKETTMDEIKTKLASRKFWGAFIGSMAPIVCSYLSDEIQLWDAVQASTAVIISYLFSQGAVDAMSAKSDTKNG